MTPDLPPACEPVAPIKHCPRCGKVPAVKRVIANVFEVYCGECGLSVVMMWQDSIKRMPADDL